MTTGRERRAKLNADPKRRDALKRARAKVQRARLMRQAEENSVKGVTAKALLLAQEQLGSKRER